MATSSSIVSVFVISPDVHSERRFDLHTTVSQLKDKLELITGIPSGNQRIEVFRNEDDTQPIALLDSDTRPLGYYSVISGQVLKVQDIDPSTTLTGQFTDVSQVEKFELTRDEYERRTGKRSRPSIVGVLICIPLSRHDT
ncbi:hypothetical protein FS842_005400 [Serendipita sp. 407]|nr:hypothetical protein FS842_005400 [Serendipita sp. 407]